MATAQFASVCSSILVALSATTGLTGQVRGSINKDAPIIRHEMKLRDGASLELEYTAIGFGEGRWRKTLEDLAGKDAFNSFAARKPLGWVKTNSVITIGRQQLPAGEHTLFFTVWSEGEDTGRWLLNLKPKKGGKAIRWVMPLRASEQAVTRFTIRLEPGEAANSCTLAFAFGRMAKKLPVTINPIPKNTPVTAAQDATARMDLIRFYDAIMLFVLQHRRVPDSWKELRQPGNGRPSYIGGLKADPKDPWGSVYEIRPLERGRFEVRSHGPDRKPDTLDDVSSRNARRR